MAFSLSQKSQRLLQFLQGARSPRVAASLASFGFREQDFAEGWQLLQDATGRFLAPKKPLNPADTEALLAQLDAFENRWFDIAPKTLARRYPELGAKLFENLAPTDGTGVTITVGELLRRLDRLPDEPDGKAALELLTQRGLDLPERRRVQALLDEFGTAKFEPVPIDDTDERLAAEDKMWGWYLEWSAVARAAIKNRRTLRELGFLRSRGSASEDEVEASEPAGGGQGTVSVVTA